jgi:hypothetical protein
MTNLPSVYHPLTKLPSVIHPRVSAGPFPQRGNGSYTMYDKYIHIYLDINICTYIHAYIHA